MHATCAAGLIGKQSRKQKSALIWPLSKGGGGLTRIQIVQGTILKRGTFSAKVPCRCPRRQFDNVQIGAYFWGDSFPYLTLPTQVNRTKLSKNKIYKKQHMGHNYPDGYYANVWSPFS